MLWVFLNLIANLLGKQVSISDERRDNNSSITSGLQPLILLRKSSRTLDASFRLVKLEALCPFRNSEHPCDPQASGSKVMGPEDWE